ncbi:MAG: hypothetical protein ACI97A_001729 [Planctomycetota bacterium]|jgi:uncharacterized protein (DUF58 family)
MKPLVFDPETRKKISAMHLRVKRVFSGEGGGAVRAKGIGTGHEFHDHRAYAEGDDFRHIDWNLFGRHGDLFIKRFRQETDLEFMIILDRSASMSVGSPPKDVFARRLACALAACFANQAQPFEIRIATSGFPGCGPRIRNESDLEIAMKALEDLDAPQGQAHLDLRQEFKLHARNRVVIFLGDFLDSRGIYPYLAALKNDKTEVIGVLLCAEEERAPALKGKVDFKDIEGAGHLRFSITPALLDRYMQRFDAHLEECRKNAVGHGLRLSIIDAESALDRAVMEIASRGALVQ